MTPLLDYLRAEKLTYAAFAARVGIVGKNPSRTIERIAKGGGTSRERMVKIVHATGGKLTLGDLMGVQA